MPFSSHLLAKSAKARLSGPPDKAMAALIFFRTPKLFNDWLKRWCRHMHGSSGVKPIEHLLRCTQKLEMVACTTPLKASLLLVLLLPLLPLRRKSLS